MEHGVGLCLSNPGCALRHVGVQEHQSNERMNMQFRGEFFNIVNHANFGGPGTTMTSATFGQITSAGRARELQFALKLCGETGRETPASGSKAR